MALFENYDRRIDKINGVLKQYGIESVEACREMCQAKGFDPYEIVKGIQPICFENACWAYTVGAAIAMKKGVKTAAEAAAGCSNRRRRSPSAIPAKDEAFAAPEIRRTPCTTSSVSCLPPAAAGKTWSSAACTFPISPSGTRSMRSMLPSSAAISPPASSSPPGRCTTAHWSRSKPSLN